MKRTLKNRPRFISEKYGKLIQQKGREEALRLYILENDEYLDGLEKELHDSLTWLTTMWHPRKDTEVAKRQAMIDQIKEVLGE